GAGARPPARGGREPLPRTLHRRPLELHRFLPHAPLARGPVRANRAAADRDRQHGLLPPTAAARQRPGAAVGVPPDPPRRERPRGLPPRPPGRRRPFRSGTLRLVVGGLLPGARPGGGYRAVGESRSGPAGAGSGAGRVLPGRVGGAVALPPAPEERSG